MTKEQIEKLRKEKQVVVDSKKTLTERNQLGQYATPYELAKEITAFVLNNWRTERPNDFNSLKFLEPAIGTGVFYSALINTPSLNVKKASGYEVDKDIFETSREIWNREGITLFNTDFTKAKPEKGLFNLLLTNPPYVRHHHINKSDKERLKKQVHEELGYNISGLTGLYCYFILLSHKWLAENAWASWLIPSEYLDVNYGKTIKTYLKEKVTLKFIHKYDPTNSRFSDALVSSSVLIYEKTKPSGSNVVRFSFGGSIDKPEFVKYVNINELNPEDKWSIHFSQDTNKEKRVVLSEFFDIKRGIATGSNEFFVLKRTQIENLQLPFECFTPLLPPARELAENIVERDENGYPVLPNQYFVLNTSLSEEVINAKYPNLGEYLEQGKRQGVLDGYLVRNRKIWYKQEERPPAPYYCTYMGRERNGENPFKFIWNKSNAIVTNGYLMLYPKGELKALLKSNPSLYQRVFEALNSIADFAYEGREYGGGLKKIEPKELGKVSAESILNIFPNYDIKEQVQFLF